MKYGKIDIKGLKQYQKQVEKLADPDEFLEDCCRELAARLLARVVKRTPVGQYPAGSGKTGGTLRRGWTGGKTQAVTSYVDAIGIQHEGHVYKITLTNPVKYAPYVEYGHRTANHKGWVNGQFFMTISENELKQIAPKVLEAKLKKYLGAAFK